MPCSGWKTRRLVSRLFRISPVMMKYVMSEVICQNELMPLTDDRSIYNYVAKEQSGYIS